MRSQEIIIISRIHLLGTINVQSFVHIQLQLFHQICENFDLLVAVEVESEAFPSPGALLDVCTEFP